MKTRIIVLLAALITVTSFAQNGINYKAIVKDGNGNLIVNQNIGLEFNIIQGSGTGATTVYSEDHNVLTDANGITIAVIGNGTPSLGDFSTLNWDVDDHFLNIMYDDFSGSTATDLGTVQFNAVPYAIEAANVTGLEAINEGNGTGWRLKGRDPDNYGDITLGAVDLSNSILPSSDFGATGLNSFATGAITIASGPYSSALGFGTKATGDRSFAFGWNNQAMGDFSTAFGAATLASGPFAISQGFETVSSGPTSLATGVNTSANGSASASFGYFTNAEAYFSLVTGRFNTGGGDSSNWIETDPLFQIGNGSDDLNRSNALNILKNGTVLAPTFDIGEITNNKALITKEYADTNYLDSNYLGSFQTVGNVTSNSSGNLALDDFVFGSTQLNDDTSTSSDNSRFFFDVSKSAFRAGYVSNENWDETNIEFGSFAAGIGTLASGYSSIALGFGTNATGDYTLALGDNSSASGIHAIAIGDSSAALGDSSIAMGTNNEAGGAFGTAFGQNSSAFGQNSTVFGKGSTAYAAYSTAIGTGIESFSYGSFTIGRYNALEGNPNDWVSANHLFAIGNGSSDTNRANALTVLKNGKLYLTPTHDDAEYADNSGYLIIGEESGVNMVFDNNEIMARDNATASPLYFQRDGGNLSIGNVGIPNAKLDVAGSIQYTGTITDVSDKRLKENFKPIENALDQISKVSAYSYNMKDDKSKNREYGVIAQELQKVFPEMVSTVDEEHGYLGVSYIQLIPVLLEAINEQQDIINKQDQENKVYQNTMQAMLVRIERLESVNINKTRL